MDAVDDGRPPVGEVTHRSPTEPTPGSTSPCPDQVPGRALEDHAVQVMLVLDAAGTLRWISPAVARTLGYQADDLAGSNVLALLHPDDVAHVRQCYRCLLAAPEAPVSLQLRVRHRDGSWRAVAVSGTNLLTVPAVRGILVIAADLTERHRIEAALRESEERFRRLADATFEAIILHDQGIILEVNHAFATLFGCSPAAAIGQSVLAFAAPESHAVIRQHIAAQSEEPYEAIGLRADGSRFVGELRGRMCPYQGRVVRVTAVRDMTERQQADEALRQSEARFHTVMEQAAEGIFLWDVTTRRLLEANTAYCTLLGYAADELQALTLYDVIAAERASIDANTQLIVEKRLHNIGPRWHRRKDGRLVEVEATASIISYRGRQVGCTIVRDITERTQAEAALRASEREYRHLFEQANDAILIFEPEGEVVLDVNGRACALYGIPRDQFIGTSLRSRSQDVARGARYLQALLATGSLEGFETVQFRSDGLPLHLYINASLIEFQGRRAVLSINRDITERKAFEAQLAHQAFHDALTGLPNRALFLDRVGQALVRASRRQDLLAVLFLDLDRFKLINDSLGHEAGDALLVAVAERLQACLRADDTVSRLGGDELTMLLEGLTAAEEALVIAERIIQALDTPFLLSGQTVSIRASIGIALSTVPAPPSVFLQQADLAMYQAKRAGLGRYAVFEPGMHGHAAERLQLEHDLRQALQRQELRLYYQPVVELATGSIVGLEALVRWQHPQRGLLLPETFIPLAEETSLVVPLGRWVLEEAGRQCQAWQADGHRLDPVFLSINLSAAQLQQPDLVTDIERVLDTSGMDPTHLQLEVTESMLMGSGAATSSLLQQVRSLGVRLALDDFGVGYSSLRYIKQFSFDALKLDRSFVAGLGQEAVDRAIVQAVIGLAAPLGQRVIAEGVETAEHFAHLRALGCTWGQGYYFGEPLPAPAIAERLRASAAGEAIS